MATTEMKVQLNVKEIVLVTLTVALVPILAAEMYGVALMRAAIPEFETDPRMPQLADLTYAIGFALLIVAARYVATSAFKPLGRYVLAPSKRIQEGRVERFATVLFKFLYFTVITGVGFYVMLDEPWMPPVLGGSGEMVNAFNAIEKPPSAALKWYYYVQFGYHIHSLIYMILLSPIRNDFIEMLLHHLATIMLIAWAYLSNYHAGGALVAITHDIGDVTGYAIKSIVDTSNTSLVVMMYIVLLVSWGYTRLYVLPFHLIYDSVVVAPTVNPHVTNSLAYPTYAMLCMLQLLHVYWYVLFLVMGYNLLKKGVQEDIQQESHTEDDRDAIQATAAVAVGKTKQA